MPDPSYRPRTYLVYPEQFGTLPSDSLEMRNQVGLLERARRAASLEQNRRVFAVRTLIIKHRLTRKQVASEIGMNYQRLSRLLTGEIVMRLEDIELLRTYFDDRAAEAQWGPSDG